MTKLKAFIEKENSNKRNDARLKALLLYLSLYERYKLIELYEEIRGENNVNIIFKHQKRK